MKALVAVAVMILISAVAFPALTPGVDRLAPVQIPVGPSTAAELGCPTGQGAATAPVSSSLPALLRR